MKYKSSAVVSLAILLLFLGTFFIPSLRAESSENRTMATFDMVLHPEMDSVVYHDSPVERLDAALSDQFPFREVVVKKYLSFINSSENLTYGVAKVFARQQGICYSLHAVGSYELIEDTGYVTTFPETDAMDENLMKRHVEQIDYIHESYPDLKIYVYYVTQAFDTSWFDNYIGTTSVDHYQEILDVIPDYVKSDCLVYQDLDDYMNIHYKTDHHWNHRGARRGYEDIYSMMKEDFELGEIYIPLSENKVSQTYDFVYLGSYGKALAGLYEDGFDEFAFYEYDLPEREMAILNPETHEEIEAVKIGLYDEYQRGEINKDIGVDHYVMMYGTARDKNGNGYSDSEYPFIIRNGEVNGKNLLICGDSYNRAMRDVLASHFGATVYLDYRVLSTLPIDYVIEKYNIDVLLISSNTSMWNSEDYFFTFREEE